MKYRLFAMMLTCVGISLSTSAENNGATYIESPMRGKYQSALSADMAHLFKVDTPVNTILDAPTRADEETFEVRCTFKYDPSLYTPNYVAAHAVDFVTREYSWGEEGEVLSLYLSAGVYDLHGEVWRDSSIGDGIGVIIQENVEVSSDMDIVFDVETLTNHISVSTLNPDGEKCVLPTWKMINEPPYYEVTDPGNINNLLTYQFYIHDDYGIISTLYGSGDYNDADTGREGERIFDFYFSNLSEKYTLCQARLIPTNEGCYMVKYYIDDLSLTEVVNNPENYKLFEESFAATPARSLFENGEYLTTMKNKVLVDGISRGGFTVLSKCESPKYYLDVPQEDEKRAFPMEVLVVPTLTDIYAPVIVQDVDWEGNPVEYETILDSKLYGVPVLQTKEGFTYIKNNHSLDGEISFQKTETSKLYVNEFPAHPGFSFSTKNAPFGNNAPVGVFGYMSYPESDAVSSYTHLRYVGRFGEIRQSDLLNLKVNMTMGESQNFTTYGDAFAILNAPHNADKFKLTITNNNVAVDGIEGFNIMEMSWDETTGDLAAPTLQMLQFKNSNGIVTDRFADPEEGMLEFAGGDFAYNYVDYYSSWFDCNAPAVKAEYAPFGTTDWKELQAEEDETMYFMPGFGHFYRSSLSSVTEKSSNGWFDLRLTLTDEKGNSQTQTISPAFRVESSLSVERVTSSAFRLVVSGNILSVKGAEAASVEIYSADGRMMTAGSGEGISTAEIPTGIYMVKITDGNNSSVLKTVLK